MSHAQFWVFPLSRKNLKDALSEHPPDGGVLVGALAGLKVSPVGEGGDVTVAFEGAGVEGALAGGDVSPLQNPQPY